MTEQPSWTPAPRPGAVPLRPWGFGTVLGASFTALRQNPRVLLGFALTVQVLSFLIVLAAVGAVSFWSFSRLQSLRESSPDYATIVAGSVAAVLVTGVVLGLAAGLLSTVVQGVVVAQVARAALAERPRLADLWRQVRPVLWRLVGYALALTATAVLAVAAATGLVVVLDAVSTVLAGIAIVLLILAAIAAALWLSAKLLLVTPVIVLEHATIRQAVVRAWRLSRTRFWAILGVVVVIQAIFGFVAQAIAVPFSLLGTVLGQVLAPTGREEAAITTTLVVGLVLPQVVSLLVQSIGIVVQATATSLLYLDCRMRHEGLDQDLLAHLERRDAGATDLADPYAFPAARTPVPVPAPAPPVAPPTAVVPPVAPPAASSATAWAAPQAPPAEADRP